MKPLDVQPNFERLNSVLTRSISGWLDGVIRIGENADDLLNAEHFEKLFALIEKYNLEEYISDFVALACVIVNTHTDWEALQTYEPFPLYTAEFELTKALRFILKYNEFQLSVSIKHKTENQSCSISNPILNKVIIDSLHDFFIEKYLIQYQGEDLKSKILNWDQFIDFYLSQPQYKCIPKRGRKRRLGMTGYSIDMLQKYLQYYTPIKASSNSEISRAQAAYIYEYLNVFDIIKDLTWKEDNIRHILKKHRIEQELKKGKKFINDRKVVDDYLIMQQGIILS